ncbi:MAG: Hpt domain-containing protein [Desulfobulbaceae bacterium]|nr:Hpt domain-containing protein [Desulfobulbaceae bacterium]
MSREMQQEEYRRIIKTHLRSAYLLSDARINEVLPRFLETLEILVSDLEKLSGSGNIEEINRTGHAIKGALLNLGLQQLAEKAYALEHYKTLQNQEAGAVQLITDLKKEIYKISREP